MRIDLINNEGPNVALDICYDHNNYRTYFLRLNTERGTLKFEVFQNEIRNYLYGIQPLNNLINGALDYFLEWRKQTIKIPREEAINLQVSYRNEPFNTNLPGAISESVPAILFNKVMTFHGYRSQPNLKRNRFLTNRGYNVFSPQIDFDSSNYVEIIRENIYREEPELLIGTSLGGYVAYYMSQEFNIPALLVNPALSGKKPIVNQPINENWYKKLILVLGGQDFDVPASKTIEFLNDQQIAYFHIYHMPNLPHEIGNDLHVFEQILNLSFSALIRNLGL